MSEGAARNKKHSLIPVMARAGSDDDIVALDIEHQPVFIVDPDGVEAGEIAFQFLHFPDRLITIALDGIQQAVDLF